MTRAIPKILRSYISFCIIKIRASDFGGGPVTFRYNWPSRPVEKLVLALPLNGILYIIRWSKTIVGQVDLTEKLC